MRCVGTKIRLVPLFAVGLSLSWVACSSHRRQAQSLGHSLESHGLIFHSQVHRWSSGDYDSVLVVAQARNGSNQLQRLCLAFDFYGGFKTAGDCSTERPPMFYLVGRSFFQTTPLSCRFVDLRPGDTFSDSVAFSIYRPDFSSCPGAVSIIGSLWSGSPDDTFGDGTLLVENAVQQDIPVP